MNEETTTGTLAVPRPYHTREKSGQFVHRFRIDGRAYTLFKLVQTKTSPFYLHFQCRGRRILRSLESSAQTEAVKRATLLVRAARGNRWAEIGQPKPQVEYATLGQVLEVYHQSAPQTVQVRTATNNVACLGHVLELALGLDWKTKSTASLDARLVRHWKEKYSVKRLTGVAEDGLEQERRRVWITGNSKLSQARSVFGGAMLRVYEDRGLKLPSSISDFLKEPAYKRVVADYRPASDALVRSTFDAVEALAVSDPNCYKVFWLAVGCGLRKGEIARTRWDWFMERSGQRWLVTDQLGKDGRPIEVPVLADSWARLAPFAAATGPVLQGSSSEITQYVFVRMSQWMRKLGWSSRKTTHELRAWTLSKIAERHGMDQASRFARHKDARTTAQNYGRYCHLRAVEIELPGKPT